MASVSVLTVRGMVQTCPWQDSQATPAAVWAPWWNRTCSGSRWTEAQGTGTCKASAVSSGANWAATFQTWRWQPRQVSAVGMPAAAWRSTPAWQKRQSRPIPPAWMAWLKGMGCGAATPTRQARSDRT